MGAGAMGAPRSPDVTESCWTPRHHENAGILRVDIANGMWDRVVRKAETPRERTSLLCSCSCSISPLDFFSKTQTERGLGGSVG